MKKITILLLIIISVCMLILTLSSCKKQLNIVEKVSLPETPIETEQPVQTETSPEPIATSPISTEKNPPEIVPCKLNTQCSTGSFCIAEKCTDLNSLMNTNCQQKCTVKEVVIDTNDGKSYTLPPGKGDYTAAGAIDWTIIRTPPHCKGSLVKVPITIFKRNYGTVLGDEAILLTKGETSAIINHPINKKVAFTLTVKDVIETC